MDPFTVGVLLFAKPEQDDHFLVPLDDEQAAEQVEDHRPDHDHLEKSKTELQGVHQRLVCGVERLGGGGPDQLLRDRGVRPVMGLVVFVMRMIVSHFCHSVPGCPALQILTSAE